MNFESSASADTVNESDPWVEVADMHIDRQAYLTHYSLHLTLLQIQNVQQFMGTLTQATLIKSTLLHPVKEINL